MKLFILKIERRREGGRHIKVTRKPKVSFIFYFWDIIAIHMIDMKKSVACIFSILFSRLKSHFFTVIVSVFFYYHCNEIARNIVSLTKKLVKCIRDITQEKKKEKKKKISFSFSLLPPIHQQNY